MMNSDQSPKTYHFILNPKAGPEEKPIAPLIEEFFQKAGKNCAVHQAATGAELAPLAREALQNNPAAIVAGGGDGTMNAVASELVGSEIPFGVLPLGTLNHFAKDLGIPLELEAALQNILHGHIKKIDVAQLNDRYFLNNSSLGIYPHIVDHRERQQEKTGRGKWLAFFLATLAVLKRYPIVKLRIQTETEKFIRKTPFLFVGNNQYVLQGFDLGSRERLDEGTLSLYIKNSTSRLALFRVAFNAFLGRLEQAPDFDTIYCREIFIAGFSRRFKVSTDGEVNRLRPPLRYKILPRALSVIVPLPPEEK